MTVKYSRGRPSEYTNQDLKNIALDVKKKLKGQKLTYKLLERETGIGRNTWSRRLKDTINVLNEPIRKNIEFSEEDEIYFPSIYDLFERYGNDESRIILELETYEKNYYLMFEELKKYRVKADKLDSIQQNYHSLKEELTIFKKKSEIYENLYKNAIVKSYYAHLQASNSPLENLIDFESDINKNSNLGDLGAFFEQVNLSNQQRKNQDEKMKQLKSLFPNLLSDDE